MKIKGVFINEHEYQIICDVFELYPAVTITDINRYLNGESFFDGDGAAYYLNKSESLSESVAEGYTGGSGSGQYYPVYVLVRAGSPHDRLYIINNGKQYGIYLDSGRDEPFLQKTFSDVLFAVPEDTAVYPGGSVNAGQAGLSGGAGASGTGDTSKTSGAADAGGVGGSSDQSDFPGASGPQTPNGSDNARTAAGTDGDNTAAGAGDTSAAKGAGDTSAKVGAGDVSAAAEAGDVSAVPSQTGVDQITFSELFHDAQELFDSYIWLTQLARGRITRLTAYIMTD